MRRAQLCGRKIVRSVFGCSVVGAELPALAPGAMGPVGRSVGSGAPQAGPSAEPSTMQWTATVRHAWNVSDPSRVLEQGPDRQRTPGGCSGGVSSMVRSLPRVVGVSIGCLANPRKGAAGRRHPSFPCETAVHQAPCQVRNRRPWGSEGFPVRAAVPDVEPLLRWQRCGASLMLFAAELSADAETCEGRSMGLQRCHYRCFRVR